MPTYESDQKINLLMRHAVIKLADYSGREEGRQVRKGFSCFDKLPIKMLDVRVRGAP